MNYKYIKYKSNNKSQIGSGFKDDISIFGSYAIYAHGMVDNTNQFILPPNKNVIYFEEFGQPMNSRKAIAIWKFFNTVNTSSISVLLKLANGCIDDEVKNYEIDGFKPFSIVRFKKGGNKINDLDIYFMPLTSGDILSEKKIDPYNEVIKSGIYSVPIGFNYPLKDYCNNLGINGSMRFIDYINKYRSFDNRLLKDIKDIDNQNTFTKYSRDTYKCGIIGDIGKNIVNIKDVCINATECDNQHNILYKKVIGPITFPDKPEFINDEYNYKAIRLSELLTKQLKDDNFNGTYFIITCRSSKLNELEKLRTAPKIDLLNLESEVKTISKAREISLRTSQEIPFEKCTDDRYKKRSLLGLTAIKKIIDKLSIRYQTQLPEKRIRIYSILQNQLKELLIEYDTTKTVPFDKFDIVQPEKGSSKRTRLYTAIDNYLNKEKERNPSIVIASVIAELIKLYNEMI